MPRVREAAMSVFDGPDVYACKDCGNVYAPDVEPDCPVCGRDV